MFLGIPPKNVGKWIWLSKRTMHKKEWKRNQPPDSWLGLRLKLEARLLCAGFFGLFALSPNGVESHRNFTGPLCERKEPIETSQLLETSDLQDRTRETKLNCSGFAETLEHRELPPGKSFETLQSASFHVGRRAS